MTTKNSTIKFLTISEEKEEADKIAQQLQLPKSQTYEAIFNLGLEQLKQALVKGSALKIEHLPSNSCKRIDLGQK